MKEFIKNQIEDFVLSYHEKQNTETKWGHPIVKFASAFDPLFEKLRSIVSKKHTMPGDILKGARTVVVYFLPFTEETAESNTAGIECSREWAQAYVETNRMIHEIGCYMKDKLTAGKHNTAVMPATHNFDPSNLISDWSHRHIAYIAGLGNFGFNNMLITEKGCCGRLGSFVIDFEVEPDPVDRIESCLFKYNGTCLNCMEKCVADAFQTGNFNRFKCHEILKRNEEKFKSLGVADVCGKCMVGVPCSHTDPVKALLK